MIILCFFSEFLEKLDNSNEGNDEEKLTDELEKVKFNSEAK